VFVDCDSAEDERLGDVHTTCNTIEASERSCRMFYLASCFKSGVEIAPSLVYMSIQITVTARLEHWGTGTPNYRLVLGYRIALNFLQIVP
jgi:hypothetical protein